MSGRDAQRGFIFQSIIAMIECLERDDWTAVKIEPETALEKVDIQLYKDGQIISAIQVKSSQNQFERSKVKTCLAEIQNDAVGAKEVCLYLIGDKFSQACNKYIEESRGLIKTISFVNLELICKGKIAEYVTKVGLAKSVRVADLQLVDASIFSRIHKNSIASNLLTRDAFEESFRSAISVSKNIDRQAIEEKVFIESPYPSIFQENVYPFEFLDGQVYPRILCWDLEDLEKEKTIGHLQVSIRNMYDTELEVRDLKIHILKYQDVAPTHFVYDNQWGSGGMMLGHVFYCPTLVEEKSFSLQYCGDQSLDDISHGSIDIKHHYGYIHIGAREIDHMHVVIKCPEPGLYTVQFELIFCVGDMERSSFTDERTWYFPRREESDTINNTVIFREEHKDGVQYETCITKNILEVLSGKKQLTDEMIATLEKYSNG